MNVYKSHQKLEEYPFGVKISNKKQWALNSKFNKRLRAVLQEQQKS